MRGMKEREISDLEKDCKEFGIETPLEEKWNKKEWLITILFVECSMQTTTTVSARTSKL